MKNLFNSVALPKVGSNAFNLSHDVKMSLKMGGLYPTVIMDCVPGDKVKISTTNMLRFAPLISPVMHKVNVTTHYFFVPNRIIWSNWERWITGDYEAEPPYIRINLTEGSIRAGCLGDYLGLPTDIGTNLYNLEFSALPIAAYLRIWNEYYRDQNLQDEYNIELTDGNNFANDVGNYQFLGDIIQGDVFKRAWMHDYFTSALPFAQKGEAVSIPIGNFEDIPVYLDSTSTNAQEVVDGTGAFLDNIYAFAGQLRGNNPATGDQPARIDPSDTLYAKTSDLSADPADINTLRRAFRLQEWLERNARGGTRYTENILAHFGVKSSDARLQRPEYLGGSKGAMVISEVLSTAETDLPVGSLAGHGISVSGGREFSYYCEEHGYIIGLINVQPVTAYMDGVPRHYLRKDRLDYYWPSFAHIGEQEIQMQEIYANLPDEEKTETFGYVPRYSEYKYLNSRVAGDMRTSLDFWHLARKFDSKPALNSQFIESNPSNRIFAVQGNQDHIYAHIFNRITAIRKMPKYGIPSF